MGMEKRDDVRLSEEPFISDTASMKNVELGAYTEIGEHNVFENVSMGAYSYTGPNCCIQNAVIGKFSNIAAAVRIGPTRHPMDRPTLHHFTYRRARYGFGDVDDAEFFSWREEQVTRIGHDTWIGHGAIIMPGVKVGDGAVVGAGAVLTRDLPAYGIAVGVPARLVKYRFPEPVRHTLSLIAWWNWEHRTIHERLKDFCGGVEDFICLYGGWDNDNDNDACGGRAGDVDGGDADGKRGAR